MNIKENNSSLTASRGFIPALNVNKKRVDLKMDKDSVYLKQGFKNRRDYLECMSEDYGVPLNVVYSLADMLGESEDFDGLISALEDAEGMFEE